MTTEYISAYFAQGEEGCADIDQISENGAAQWLDIMAGAIDFTDGETTTESPWGTGDSLVHSQTIDAQTIVLIHANYVMGYVSITTQIKE